MAVAGFQIEVAGVGNGNHLAGNELAGAGRAAWRSSGDSFLSFPPLDLSTVSGSSSSATNFRTSWQSQLADMLAPKGPSANLVDGGRSAREIQAAKEDASAQFVPGNEAKAEPAGSTSASKSGLGTSRNRPEQPAQESISSDVEPNLPVGIPQQAALQKLTSIGHDNRGAKETMRESHLSDVRSVKSHRQLQGSSTSKGEAQPSIPDAKQVPASSANEIVAGLVGENPQAAQNSVIPVAPENNTGEPATADRIDPRIDSHIENADVGPTAEIAAAAPQPAQLSGGAIRKDASASAASAVTSTQLYRQSDGTQESASPKADASLTASEHNPDRIQADQWHEPGAHQPRPPAATQAYEAVSIKPSTEWRNSDLAENEFRSTRNQSVLSKVGSMQAAEAEETDRSSLSRNEHSSVANGTAVFAHRSAQEALRSSTVQITPLAHNPAGASSFAVAADSGVSPNLSTSAKAATRDTFAVLDGGAEAPGPAWIHAGNKQAEAGFQDPVLGWVGVRAEVSGGTVHATVAPSSLEAAQALGGHMAGLNAYLAENRTPVDTVTLAQPDNGGTMGFGHGDQGTGQSGYAGRESTDLPAGAATRIASEDTAGNSAAAGVMPDRALAATIAGGMYISVMA